MAYLYVMTPFVNLNSCNSTQYWLFVYADAFAYIGLDQNQVPCSVLVV